MIQFPKKKKFFHILNFFLKQVHDRKFCFIKTSTNMMFMRILLNAYNFLTTYESLHFSWNILVSKIKFCRNIAGYDQG